MTITQIGKFESIQTAAKKLANSSAKTSAGARRALIKNYLPKIQGRGLRAKRRYHPLTTETLRWSKAGHGFSEPQMSAKQSWYRAHRRDRLNRGAQTIAAANNLPTRYEAFEAGDHSPYVLTNDYHRWLYTQWEELSDQSKASATNLIGTDTTDGVKLVRFGEHYILLQSWQTVGHWEKYGSRSYPTDVKQHRSAYLLTEGWDKPNMPTIMNQPPSETALDMGLFHRIKIEGYGFSMVSKKTEFTARGNWQKRVIAELFELKPQKQAGLSHVQIDPIYQVEKLRTLRGVEVYRRTLADQPIDFVAVIGRATYHAETQRKAVSGLAQKLTATGDTAAHRIDLAWCYNQGFCRPGVEEFCEMVGLDIEKAYTRKQIERAVKKTGKEKLCEIYSYELAKVGIEC